MAFNGIFNWDENRKECSSLRRDSRECGRAERRRATMVTSSERKLRRPAIDSMYRMCSHIEHWNEAMLLCCRRNAMLLFWNVPRSWKFSRHCICILFDNFVYFFTKVKQLGIIFLDYLYNTLLCIQTVEILYLYLKTY